MITGAISVVLLIAMFAAGSNGEWGSVAVGAVLVLFLLGLGSASRTSDRAYNNRVEYWAMDGKERAKARIRWNAEARKEEEEARQKRIDKILEDVERSRQNMPTNEKRVYTGQYNPVRTVPVESSDYYKTRSAMSDILMTNNIHATDRVYACPCCGKQVRTRGMHVYVKGDIVTECRCPTCGSTVRFPD